MSGLPTTKVWVLWNAKDEYFSLRRSRTRPSELSTAGPGSHEWPEFACSREGRPTARKLEDDGLLKSFDPGGRALNDRTGPGRAASVLRIDGGPSDPSRFVPAKRIQTRHRVGSAIIPNSQVGRRLGDIRVAEPGLDNMQRCPAIEPS